MLRFSIMTGIILSTLNLHPLKAFDVNDSESKGHTVAAASPSVNGEKETPMEAWIRGLNITIPPEGIPMYLPGGDGREVVRLFPDGYTANMAFFDPTGEKTREQERKQQYDQFLDNNGPLIEKLDKISGERAFNWENSPSTNYAWRAIIDGQSFANLEIGFFALRHREDNRVLMEVFKGISPEERKKHFNTLLILFSPKFEELTTRMIGKKEHDTLKGLKTEIMELPFDPSKTDLLAILKSLKIKSLFEKEGDSYPASSSQQ